MKDGCCKSTLKSSALCQSRQPQQNKTQNPNILYLAQRKVLQGRASWKV